VAVYSKSTRDRFPDFCDQRIHGVSAANGLPFEVFTSNIVNNDMTWANTLNGFTKAEWRRLIREGKSATTNMDGNEYSVSASKCFLDVGTTQTNGAPGNFSCTEWKGYPLYAFPNLDVPTEAVLSDVRSIALAKFLANAKKARNNANYGETLGEWRETVRAIRRPLSALRDFIIRWRKRSKKRLRVFTRNGRRTARRDPNFRDGNRRRQAEAKALAQTYLEFVFGWIPLVKSTNEAVERMLDRWGRPETASVSGKASRDYNGTSAESLLFTKDYLRVTQGVKTYSHMEHKYRACLLTGAVNGEVGILQTLGLLPSDWVPTLYELFPWSFVLDYFLQVGELVNAMSFRKSWIKWGTSTLHNWTQREYSVPIVRVNPATRPSFPNYRTYREDAWGGNAVLKRKTVARSDILDANLLPEIYWHMPWNRKAWVNMAAIFTSNFAKA